ncbi:hypothetical protein H4R35_000120 [Dimargaris xerosporica]|nr:hypothetical protein H4R35_000120 [Dimargaris xerosporica]
MLFSLWSGKLTAGPVTPRKPVLRTFNAVTNEHDCSPTSPLPAAERCCSTPPPRLDIALCQAAPTPVPSDGSSTPTPTLAPKARHPTLPIDPHERPKVSVTTPLASPRSPLHEVASKSTHRHSNPTQGLLPCLVETVPGEASSLPLPLPPLADALCKQRRNRGQTFYHPLPHVMQWFSWDCGLACVAMVLSYYSITDYSYDDMLRCCSFDSIWTIDLAYIIRQFLGIDFTYYTRYLGINPDYAGNTFYQDTIDSDQQRVEHLFSVAHRSNVRIIRIPLPLLDLKRFVAEQKFAIILLVNAKLLHCIYCSVTRSSTNDTPYGCLHSYGKDKEYVGHFIVVVSYNFIHDTFYYRDPALADEVCQIKACDLEAARSSDGTDFDRYVL